MIRLYDEDCETIIAFIKMHEREEIPDDVWELCMRLYDAVYGVEDGYAEGYGVQMDRTIIEAEE